MSTRNEAFAVSLARFGGWQWCLKGESAAEWTTPSTAMKSGSYASPSVPASPPRRHHGQKSHSADAADEDTDCWTWKLRIDPGRKFLKSTVQAAAAGSGGGGGGASTQQEQEDHSSSTVDDDSEVSDNETLCQAFDIWGAAEKKKNERLKRSATPKTLPTTHSDSAVAEYTKRLRHFYSTNSPMKTEKDVDDVVRYYIAKGGNPMSGMGGQHQLDMNLRKTYGVGLAESSAAAAGGEGSPSHRQQEEQKQKKHRSLNDAISGNFDDRSDADEEDDDDGSSFSSSSSSYTSYASYSSSGAGGERVEESVVV